MTKLNNNLNNFERRLSKKSARGRIQRVVPEAFRKSSSTGDMLELRPCVVRPTRGASAAVEGGAGPRRDLANALGSAGGRGRSPPDVH